MPDKVRTIPITNFSGRLTRYLDGDLNSGFAKFSTSWGYDPFSKPGNLTWLYQPDEIASNSVSDLILDATTYSPTANEQYVYAIGNASRVYRIDATRVANALNVPLWDNASAISAVGSVSGDFDAGGDIEGFLGGLYISSDDNIVKTDIGGSNPASITGSSSMQSGIYHPMRQFQGALYYGDGNNIGKIDSTGTVTNGAVLSPELPTGMFIRDLDVTPDGTYLVITASYLYSDNFTQNDVGQQFAVQSFVFYWNGSDDGITAFESLPSFAASNLTTFLDRRYTFSQDAFGTALFDGKEKLLTLPDNLYPMPNGSAPNGTFLTWVAPEGTGAVSNSDTTYDNVFASIYYFGKLDAENPAGLWRIARITPTADHFTKRVPLNMMVNNFNQSRQNVTGWGKHYISVWEEQTDGTDSYKLYRFVLPPAANTNPQLGVYETQNQLFSKRAKIKQIRVYTEPTAANNGFQLDIIGSDGNPVTNGTFTYTFAAGTDPTKLQGALERINFDVAANTSYSFGLRLTNTGTANMTISKIELDIIEEGK